MAISRIREAANGYRAWKGSRYDAGAEMGIDADMRERIESMDRDELVRIVIEVERYRRDLLYAARLADHHATLADRDGVPSGHGIEARVMRDCEGDIDGILYGDE
jgi:hypothetical protein